MTVMLGLVLSMVGLARGGEIVVVDEEWGGGGIISCELSIPDAGQWAQSWVVSGAPPGARVTGVSYWVVLSDPWDVLGVFFDCSDYEIGFSSTARGGISNYFLVWDNAGDATCHAVNLSSSTNVFNGQPVNQTWYFRARDTVANGKYACFKKLKLNIQYDDGAPDSACCFTLPYEGSVSEPGEAFQINNTYSGMGRSYGGLFYARGQESRGVLGQSAGSDGRGVQGYASNEGNVQNYGGYFTAAGNRGIGVRAKGGPNGYAGRFEGDVQITGADNGIVFPDGTKQTTAGGGGGAAGGLTLPYEGTVSTNDKAFSITNTGDGVGVWGEATSGFYGRGVYGSASGGAGNGVRGETTGGQGSGVCGIALNEGNYTNHGGFFRACGATGRGDYGESWNMGDYTNYGGYFMAYGKYGVGIYAKGGPSGYAGEFDGVLKVGSIEGGPLIIKSPTTGQTVIELGEGLDYAEGFEVSDKKQIASGSVLIIDADHPGKLALSTEAYDKKVAGIVAGAKGQGSGVRLGTGQFDCDVALAGRVYCNVDTTEHGVEPGDLLTTSATPGYAMKATDYMRAQGAILGKAMEKLEKGKKGQILVLVTLQ